MMHIAALTTLALARCTDCTASSAGLLLPCTAHHLKSPNQQNNGRKYER